VTGRKWRRVQAGVSRRLEEVRGRKEITEGTLLWLEFIHTGGGVGWGENPE